MPAGELWARAPSRHRHAPTQVRSAVMQPEAGHSRLLTGTPHQHSPLHSHKHWLATCCRLVRAASAHAPLQSTSARAPTDAVIRCPSSRTHQARRNTTHPHTLHTTQDCNNNAASRTAAAVNMPWLCMARCHHAGAVPLYLPQTAWPRLNTASARQPRIGSKRIEVICWRPGLQSICSNARCKPYKARQHSIRQTSMCLIHSHDLLHSLQPVGLPCCLAAQHPMPYSICQPRPAWSWQACTGSPSGSMSSPRCPSLCRAGRDAHTACAHDQRRGAGGGAACGGTGGARSGS